MKISALTNMMNDHGTKPRVRVLKHTDGVAILVYEGSPQNMDESIEKLKVNSFTVLGAGFVEIHTK